METIQRVKVSQALLFFFSNNCQYSWMVFPQMDFRFQKTQRFTIHLILRYLKILIDMKNVIGWKKIGLSASTGSWPMSHLFTLDKNIWRIGNQWSLRGLWHSGTLVLHYFQLWELCQFYQNLYGYLVNRMDGMTLSVLRGKQKEFVCLGRKTFTDKLANACSCIYPKIF